MHIFAKILLNVVPEVGLKDRIKSGLRPSFNFSGKLVACEVLALNKLEWIDIGREQFVEIVLPYADELGWNLQAGTEFGLNVGGKVIGKGVVCEPLPHLN